MKRWLKHTLSVARGAGAPYGKLPWAVRDFESTYDPASGGYRVGLDGHLGYASVELEVGRLWYALVRLLRPRVVLETGTHRGYSTCNLAAALRDLGQDGHVWTIDPIEHNHLWLGTDLVPRITFLKKTSDLAFESLKGKTFDLLVLDSDHHYSTIIEELRLFEPCLKVGGHILMHDSLYFDGVGAAVKQLGDDPRFEMVTLDTPRTSGEPARRPPGVTIVRKAAAGPAVVPNPALYNWHVGDPWQTPLLRGGAGNGQDIHVPPAM